MEFDSPALRNAVQSLASHALPAFATGSSRVSLQVHFATDVLAGFASGSAWLAVCMGALELARYGRARRLAR